MRPAALWLLALAALASARAELQEEPWVEEEDLEEPYDEEPGDAPDRRTRDQFVADPYEDRIRVKRRCDDEPVDRARRSAEYQRVPRQVHQYEVYESTDEGSFPSPPYEEMLAASAEHYHRAYAAPGAPASARYLRPDVSAAAAGPLGVRPVPSQPAYVSPVYAVSDPQPPLSVYTPVRFVAAEPISVAEAAPALAGDQRGAAAGHHHQHRVHGGHGHAAGGGHKQAAAHHAAHGGKSTKGYDSQHHTDKGGKGHKTDELHRKEYEEAGGKKRKHHDHAGHQGGHEEEARGHRGAHFDEKKGHKKGHKTKGYHNKYHKDEFHKEHKFYDDFHKSGEHHRFGKFHAKHASDESGKKKAHHVDAGHDFVERGKKGYSNKGHLDADHKGYKGKHGHEEHHEKHAQHGKKGGGEGGKQWGYAKKN